MKLLVKAQVTWGSAAVRVTSTSEAVGSVAVPLQTMETGAQTPSVELSGTLLDDGVLAEGDGVEGAPRRSGWP